MPNPRLLDFPFLLLKFIFPIPNFWLIGMINNRRSKTLDHDFKWDRDRHQLSPMFPFAVDLFCKLIQSLMSSSSDHQPPETPLLDQEQPPSDEDDDLGQTLQWLETFLTLLGFNQSSTRSLALSWIVFLTVGLVVPVTVLELGHCRDCERYQYKSFELNIVVSQACLAGVSLLCVSHNLRKHGIRKFLFVDQLSGRMGRLKAQYIQQISVILSIFGSESLC